MTERKYNEHRRRIECKSKNGTNVLSEARNPQNSRRSGGYRISSSDRLLDSFPRSGEFSLEVPSESLSSYLGLGLVSPCRSGTFGSFPGATLNTKSVEVTGNITLLALALSSGTTGNPSQCQMFGTRGIGIFLTPHMNQHPLTHYPRDQVSEGGAAAI